MSKVSKIRVPNHIPKGAKLAIIGESPGQDEEDARQPFVGTAGQVIMQALGRFGITRDDVALLNISQYRPQGNRFDILEETADGRAAIKHGIAEIRNYLQTSKPNVIGLLGEKPLNYLTDKYGIGRYRGSILPCKFDSTIKTVAARHPAFIARTQKEYPIFYKDIERLVSESGTPDFNYTKREYHVVSSGVELIDWQHKLLKCDILSVDIENIKPTRNKKDPSKDKPLDIICVGFGISKHLAIVMPWNAETQPVIKSILEAKHIKKVFHYGTHDVNVLWLFGIDTENYYADTLTMQHALEPEQPRSLDFLTSIYTREPYYKKEGRGELPTDTKVWAAKTDKNTVYVYNGKDDCCTFEVYEQLMKLLEEDKDAYNIFQHEMKLLEVAFAMSRTGMLVDTELQETFRKSLLHKWATKQQILNAVAGKSVNVNSKKDMPWLLYDKLNLPVRRNRGSGITTDEDAIISLMTYCKTRIGELKQEKAIAEWEIKYEACKLVMEIRGIRKMLSSYINVRISDDGKVRSTYKVSNTETGRWAAEKWIDDTGYNAQTMPRGSIPIVEELTPLPSLDEMLAQLKEEEVEA